jgi:hypothetical protein
LTARSQEDEDCRIRRKRSEGDPQRGRSHIGRLTVCISGSGRLKEDSDGLSDSFSSPILSDDERDDGSIGRRELVGALPPQYAPTPRNLLPSTIQYVDNLLNMATTFDDFGQARPLLMSWIRRLPQQWFGPTSFVSNPATWLSGVRNTFGDLREFVPNR